MIQSVNQEQITDILREAFLEERPAPIVLLDNTDQIVSLLSSFAGDTRSNTPAPKFVAVSTADLALAASARVLPHAPGSFEGIQRAQRVLAKLRSLFAATSDSVIAVRLSGQESASEMNRVMEMLLSSNVPDSDVSSSLVVWHGPSASSLPPAYRNKATRTVAPPPGREGSILAPGQV